MKQLTLILMTVVFFTGGKTLSAQDEPKSPPLKLSIKTEAEKICAGTNFVIVSRLENITKQDIIIDTRVIGRYEKDIAWDQVSNDVFKVPNMRAILGDHFEDLEVPTEYLLKLKPGEFFEAKRTINPNKGNFFKFAGRYTMQTGYGQFKDWSSKGVNLYIGDVDSNELEFKILDCQK